MDMLMELGTGFTYITAEQLPFVIPVMHRNVHPAVFSTHSILLYFFLTSLHHPILRLTVYHIMLSYYRMINRNRVIQKF
jgi:hypothetical protein